YPMPTTEGRTTLPPDTAAPLSPGSRRLASPCGVPPANYSSLLQQHKSATLTLSKAAAIVALRGVPKDCVSPDGSWTLIEKQRQQSSIITWTCVRGLVWL